MENSRLNGLVLALNRPGRPGIAFAGRFSIVEYFRPDDVGRAPATSEPLNRDVAARLEEVAHLLRDQGADRYRVGAYMRAADTVRHWPVPVARLYRERGLEGLDALPGVGERIGRSIRELVTRGRLPMLDRLRGEFDATAVLATVPGIGRRYAERLHEELGLETLEDLEAAAHDGRLATIAGIGEKRLAGIRDSLAHRLGRVRSAAARAPDEPSVAELLDVDREYRQKASAGALQLIAPRRFNPTGEAWLPVLHTRRGRRRYTALFSNTARAHRAGRTHDWVVLYVDDEVEKQYTVITAQRGRLRGRRVVAGREAECGGIRPQPRGDSTIHRRAQADDGPSIHATSRAADGT